jgi:hypothetical protein
MRHHIGKERKKKNEKPFAHLENEQTNNKRGEKFRKRVYINDTLFLIHEKKNKYVTYEFLSNRFASNH